MLEHLQTRWIDKVASSSILWLRGPSGSARSVIIPMLARELDEARLSLMGCRLDSARGEERKRTTEKGAGAPKSSLFLSKEDTHT